MDGAAGTFPLHPRVSETWPPLSMLGIRGPVGPSNTLTEENTPRMGRPYRTELSAFPETYEWALGLDVEDFAAALRRAAKLPLLAVGSGGSLSAAQFCADLHQQATGRMGRAVTPLEAVAVNLRHMGAAAAVFSAGGRNADIRMAFESVLASEPPVCWVVTGAAQSPLAQLARVSSIAPLLVAQSPPVGRDGFLATNSLLAFVLQTHRAYTAAFPGIEAGALPADWSAFAGDGLSLSGAGPRQLGAATTLIVLHGYTTRAAAVDLESKGTEAGLLHVQLADYRNFAHGRHHWLAKHPETAVLALVAPEDSELAERTLKILPRSIPQSQMTIEDRGFRGGLRALVDIMRLVQEIGLAKGIDPGRPGVPDFGGKLYSLRGLELIRPTIVGTRKGVGQESAERMVARQAIERKIRRPFAAVAHEEACFWLTAYDTARAHLAAQEFAGVVFDYDGTLVAAVDRYTGPRVDVLRALTSLLERGATVGIATGRGQSAGRELRAALPSKYWARVLMGYYNASDIALLGVDSAPDRRPDVDDTLADLLAALMSSPTISRHAAITPRRRQITLEPHDTASADDLWAAAEGMVLRHAAGARLVRSGHSIDLLAPGVSKLALVDAVSMLATGAKGAPVLRIGDRARWPGNDAELLAGPDGVSVDEVSADPASAWNFAPPGVRGVEATLVVLDLLSVLDDRVRLTWDAVEVSAPVARMPRLRKAPAGATQSPASRRKR